LWRVTHTRTFGILVKFFGLNSEGMSKPRRFGKFRFFESEPLPSRLSLWSGTPL